MRQIVAWGERDATPTVWTVDGAGGVAATPLTGAFQWRLGPERRCTGKWDGETRLACPVGAVVAEHAQCAACSGLEDMECVFEPRCQREGIACHCTFGPEPHVVYLAFFGTLPKVGMTLERRIATRLREQGADAYFVVQKCADRGTARSSERAISYLHRIPEHRSYREVLPQLARPVPWTQIESRAAELQRRMVNHFPAAGALQKIVDHSIRQPLGGIPYRAVSWGAHEGTWLGSKGNNLLYQAKSSALPVGRLPIVALKGSDLVGRTVEIVEATGSDGKSAPSGS